MKYSFYLQRASSFTKEARLTYIKLLRDKHIYIGNCDVVIYNKKDIFGPCPQFWHRAPDAS